MIVESIVTTLDAAGRPNFAPMGVEWGEETIVLKPFLETATFRNLRAGGAAVVNLTDDVRVFVRAALRDAVFPARPAAAVDGVVLEAATSWREVTVASIDDAPPRARIAARVVHAGRGVEALGFSRARHAVLEGTILATRTHLIAADEIRREIQRLAVLVEKTAGPREHEAWAELLDALAERGVAT